MKLFILHFLAENFVYRSPSGKILLTKMARGVKVWSAEVSECILACSVKMSSIPFRTAFARRPLIGIHRLKWLHGSLMVMVRILVPYYFYMPWLNWLPCYIAFLSIEESTATKLVSLILSFILKVNQTYLRTSTAMLAAIHYIFWKEVLRVIP